MPITSRERGWASSWFEQDDAVGTDSFISSTLNSTIEPHAGPYIEYDGR